MSRPIPTRTTASAPDCGGTENRRPGACWRFALALQIAGWAALPAGGQIFVPNSPADRVTVYPLDADGDVAPMRSLTGGATGIGSPFALAVDCQNLELFVSNFSDFVAPESITIYGLAADGNVAPFRTLVGGATQLHQPIGIHVDPLHDELFVRNFGGSTILVFARTAAGNTAPIRTLSGAATTIAGNSVDLFVDVVNDELLVLSRSLSGLDSVLVFPRTASGNVAPSRQIAGPATGLDEGYGLVVDSLHDEILVANGDSVLVFARTADGDAAPLRTITGPATGLGFGATGIDLDLPRDELFVTLQGDNGVLAFDRTASGDAAPLRTIAGGSTGLSGPALLGVTSCGIFADGFESGDTSAWDVTVP